jgi:hypothetical protein
MSRTTGLRRWRKWWNRERLHLRGGGRSAGSGRRQRWSSATREVRERADARAALAYRAPDTHVAHRFHETAETSLSGIPLPLGSGVPGKAETSTGLDHTASALPAEKAALSPGSAAHDGVADRYECLLHIAARWQLNAEHSDVVVWHSSPCLLCRRRWRGHLLFGRRF